MKNKNFLFTIGMAIMLLLACNIPTFADNVGEDDFQALSPTPPEAPPESSPERSGSVFYVSEDGSDENQGAEDSPWLTLQYAVDHASSGATILVQEGTYAGARIEQSGNADAWIALMAAPGANVILNEPGPENKHDSILEIETWEGDGIVAYWIIEGFEISNAPSSCIDLRGNEDGHVHHIVVRRNLVHDCGLESGRTGIFNAFADDILIEGNESHSNGEHGIYYSNSGDRFIIRGNTLHHNAGSGIHLNGDASMGGDGILSGGMVEGNIIYENGYEGGAGINMDGVQDSTIRNNLLYDNHAGGIAVFQGDGAICSQDNRFLHNTVVMPEDGRWALNIAGEDCVNNKVFNNIFLTAHDWRGSITIPISDLPGFESDYNILLDRLSTDDGESTISAAAWHDLGFDAQSTMVDTLTGLFVDPSSGDFHLTEGSPAVDAGQMRDVPIDLEGTPRPAGAGVDIGAYEFSDSQTSETEDGTGSGTISFVLDGHIHLLEINESSTPVDITNALDVLSPGGEDSWLNISPDGEWLLIETTRFDPECTGWACLVLLPRDLSSAEVILSDGMVIHNEGFSAVGNGGNLIVYTASDDGSEHALDLWAISRSENGWTTPVLLTEFSPYSWNDTPAISMDNSTILFDCGDTPYGQNGTAICEATTNGDTLSVLLTPTEMPGGEPEDALHSADYAPDGSIIFEGDIDGELIWRWNLGTEPAIISGLFGNDNSPCVLPNGWIASLWLDREGGEGDHELKLMSPDGSDHSMAIMNEDVFDVGIGCGSH